MRRRCSSLGICGNGDGPLFSAAVRRFLPPSPSSLFVYPRGTWAVAAVGAIAVATTAAVQNSLPRHQMKKQPVLTPPSPFLHPTSAGTHTDIRKMTKKRRNGGRNKHGRGHVRRVRCESSAMLVPKDKAIKRFIVRNIVDASAIRDLQDACAIENYALPKIYRKVYYSISAAIHSKIVRVRSVKNRRIREPPKRPGFRK